MAWCVRCFSDLSCCYVCGLRPLSHPGLSVAAQGGLGKVGGRVTPSLIGVVLGLGRENEELSGSNLSVWEMWEKVVSWLGNFLKGGDP